MKQRLKLLTIFLIIYCTISVAQNHLRLIRTISGESEGDHSSKVCPIGDVNKDRYDDFIVGSSKGKYVKLYLGGSPFDTLNYLRFFSSEQYTAYTSSYIGGGDLNGDGYKDFALIQTTFYGSRTLIYFGKTNIDTSRSLTIEGISAIAMNGDLNGDGYDDLVTVAGVLWQGRVNIYFGGIGMKTVPDITIMGKSMEDTFGWDATIVGDVNKDGYDDLLVGAPEMFNQLKHGKAYIFFGGEVMGWNNSVEIKADSTAYEYGIEVSRLGDVDRDGYPDFAIRSWYVDIISGKTLSLIKKIIPDKNWGTFLSVSNGYDLNGDGYNDFILGFENKVNKYTGGTAVYLGGKEIDTIPAQIINGNSPNSYYAKYITIGGDINGDNKAEVFIGENGLVTMDG